MQREVSDETHLSGLFLVDTPAATAADGEAEATDCVTDAIADEPEYWERLTSALIDELAAPAPSAVTAQVLAERWERRMRRYEQRSSAARRLVTRQYLVHASYGGTSNYAQLADEPVVVPDFDAAGCLAFLEQIDEIFLKPLSDNVCEALPELDRPELEKITAAYSHMMATFQHPRFKQLYGYQAVRDRAMCKLKFGDSVPSYYANVVSQSMFQRKVLSMAGLRNLIMYGPVIYHDLREALFSGEQEAYPDSGRGLNLMRTMTGNVVDLDTTVLRCNCKATLNAINASNAHPSSTAGEAYKGMSYTSADQFGRSAQAAAIAMHCAKPLLEDFAKLMDLRDETSQKKRKIHVSQMTSPIPLAQSNTDRGRWPLWHYVNVGQDSFHCNVPSMSDVNGALLKAPFHCAQQWCLLQVLFKDNEAERMRREDDFFENCVADACFNLKWKCIEEYTAKVAHEGSIVDVLQRLQMEHQEVFTMAFFDADDDQQSNEIGKMWELAEGKMGRETRNGGVARLITKDDVKKWVLDPSCQI